MFGSIALAVPAVGFFGLSGLLALKLRSLKAAVVVSLVVNVFLVLPLAAVFTGSFESETGAGAETLVATSAMAFPWMEDLLDVRGQANVTPHAWEKHAREIACLTEIAGRAHANPLQNYTVEVWNSNGQFSLGKRIALLLHPTWGKACTDLSRWIGEVRRGEEPVLVLIFNLLPSGRLERENGLPVVITLYGTTKEGWYFTKFLRCGERNQYQMTMKVFPPPALEVPCP